MVVFKMRDSLPSARYSPICNVLRQWKTSLIPIYRVYTDCMIIAIALLTKLKFHVIKKTSDLDWEAAREPATML